MLIVKPCNVGGDPTQGLHGYTERREKPRMRGFPTAMNRGIDEGRAVGWGRPKRVEPSDMDPDEKGS